ncbi:MAG: UDP-N-acetylmuramoyl-tripeptide--D-alanyl-D-alanine ligase [Proteobacteria bacterium]|nr:UDP-N-acetylmuramoyl-tripeptide--D-alanyl-D-alanine ligase [Pseudomonadota bacterium]
MMTLQAAALATRGSATQGDRQFTGVSTDTRDIAAGDLFIALKGERFDGHAYVRQALAQGAAAVLVESAWAELQSDDLPLIAVEDTRLALGELAANWRSRFVLPLIGITGSNGKTTVKEMCAAIFREQARRAAPDTDPAESRQTILATEGNLNNDIGLPLMLLKMRERHVAAVIEMGMNHPGEIAYLTNIARPTVAVITNAQRAHLEGLGGLSAVARAKGEIFVGLAQDGVAVINADDPHAAIWRELNRSRSVLSFGLTQAADITARYTPLQFGSLLKLITPQGEPDREVTLNLPGAHNIMNALAALAATLAAGVPLDAIAAGLSGFSGVHSRLQRRKARHGALLIDDSYNANPDSVRAAIDVLASLPGKKILVFGDMGEVGEQAGQFHDEIGGYAKSMGVDRMLALGEHAAAAARNFDGGAEHFKNVGALVDALLPLLDADTTVLVKGSRFMKMERVVEAIVEP